MRTAKIERATRETDIKLSINLDGKGDKKIDTNCGFFNHMLELLFVHAGFDGEVYCKGDVEVDYHHTVEDVAICLGQAVDKALGDRRQITRYADIILPMDEALIVCAMDISGRGGLNFDVEMPAQKVYDDSDETKRSVGDFDTELCEEFFVAFTRESKINIHFKKLYGKNTHHIIEGVFKAFARCLKKAVSIDETISGIPSSKGVL